MQRSKLSCFQDLIRRLKQLEEDNAVLKQKVETIEQNAQKDNKKRKAAEKEYNFNKLVFMHIYIKAWHFLL